MYPTTPDIHEIDTLRALIRVVVLADGPQGARETVDRLCRMVLPNVPSEVTRGLADRLYRLADGL